MPSAHDKPRVPVPDLLVDLKLPVLREFASRLRFAPNEGRIWLDERRMVLLHAEAFGELREELIASLGVDVARGLLTRIGYAAGCRDAEMAWRMAGSGASVEQVIRTGSVMHAMQGFVLAEFMLNPESSLVFEGENFYGEWVWKQSLEDENHVRHHGVGGHAACWNEVGYSSGYLSTCAGRRILVREVECISMGHPHCRNIAKPVTSWEQAEEDLRFMEPQPAPAARVYAAPAPAGAPRAAPARPEDIVVGASAASHLLRHKVLRVAPTNATVLLLGESGVGKSMCARDLHRNSRRGERAFVEVNCAAIPEQLVESELFGVERGAYSGATSARPGRFEAADGGTLFLDEITSLSMTAQGKLLRVLQNGEFERLGSNRTLHTDVRLIAATNENLRTAVSEGRFREDLFFRLNVFPLLIQPLRERRDDIPPLVETLILRFSRRHGRAPAGIAPRAMRTLLHHSWPGNIRELENVLERGVILAQDGELIDVHHLFSVEDASGQSPALSLGREGLLVAMEDRSPAPGQDALDALAATLLQAPGMTLDRLEASVVRAALRETGGNVSKAASLLGVTRAQLDYRVRKQPELRAC